ncbi:MAG: response regulator [Burkholderiales bacterium]|nr:response regulator [Burkholderiales bacterium]
MKSSRGARRGVWLAATLFSLLVVGVAAGLLGQIGRNAERAAVREAEALARNAETTLNRNLLQLDLLLAGLEQLPWIRGAGGADAAPASALLRVLVDQRLLLLDLALLDAGGSVLAAAHEATTRLGPGLPPGFLASVLAQPAPDLTIGAPATHPGTGERVIHLARAVGPPGPARRVALATLPVSELVTLLSPALPVEGLWIAVETAPGRLLASVPPNDSLLGRSRPWAQDLPPAPGRQVAGRLDGAPSYAATRTTLYNSVRVSAGIRAEAVLAATAGARFATLAVAGVFVALALAAGGLAQTAILRLTAASADARNAHQVLEEALASIDESFLLWGPDERLVAWNERCLTLFPYLRPVMRVGAHVDEIAQAAARAILPDADEAARRAWIGERMAARRRDGREFEQHLPGGIVVATSERRTANGGIVSISRDVTARRAAAAELQRARHAAEAANEAKTRFLATMSHEIRTPLNGVLGMNSLLLATRLDDRQRMYAQTIHRSGEALLAIINDILDISRLEAGRVTLEPAPFDPRTLVDEVATLLRPRAAEKGVTLVAVHGTGVPARLLGDAGRIRQILVNLAGNAVKFTDQGRIELASDARTRDDGRVDWLLAVRDTGIGIAPDALPTLFDRFTQADSGIARQFGGSGLGLAISRELAGLMGGTIEVDSRPGDGSEFRVSLPLPLAADPADPAAAPSATAAETQPGGPGAGTASGHTRRLRVLVAEDNPVNQMLLAAMLDQLGHAAEVVGDGRAALQRVQQQHYDLVLMDIQMPELDGVAAARAIRRLSGAAGSVPIVAVSANVLAEQRAGYRDAGMNDLVTKPIDMARLAEAIAGATGHG